MTSKLITLGVLGIVSASALAAGGCATTDTKAPYSLTGEQQATADQKHQEWLLRQRFTDDKGHYRPEFAAANQTLR